MSDDQHGAIMLGRDFLPSETLNDGELQGK